MPPSGTMLLPGTTRSTQPGTVVDGPITRKLSGSPTPAYGRRATYF